MLRGTAQQILKALHLICVGLNLGGTGALWGLLYLAETNTNLAGLPLVLFDWLVAPAYYGLLATGVVYSLFTNWGFARYYWILAKWLLALLLFAGTVFLLSPALAGTGAYALARPDRLAAYRVSALFWTALFGAVLFGIVFISTMKPWGRPGWEWKIARPVRLILVLGAAGLAVSLGAWNHVLLERRRSLPISRINFSSMGDGAYIGIARFEFPYEVELVFRRGRLESARMRANRDSEYARFAEQVLGRVLSAQSLQVDAVSGATTTSVAILKAAENAILRPRAEREPAGKPSDR